MSKNFEGFIAAFEDFSWRGDSFNEYYPLWVDNESFDTGKEIINNNNLTRASRVNNGSSQVGGAVKPSASFTYQPREKDILGILYSHFQMGSQWTEGTTPGTYVMVPSRYPPTFTEDDEKVEGDYDTVAGDVYSVSFLKKYFDTSEYGGTNSILFHHGLCDKLTVNMAAGEDLTFECSYKFRDLIDGTTISDNPPSASIGTYETAPPFEWFHGTVTVAGASLDLKQLTFSGNNNLVERLEIGRRDPENFAFRDYDVSGQFTLDFPKDGMKEIGSMFALKPFAIDGTIARGTAALYVSMPYCIRKPFNVSLNDQKVSSTIPFVALENGGNSPITVKLIASGLTEAFNETIWDGWDGARTFAEFAIKDAGDGARTLSEYTYYDRDL